MWIKLMGWMHQFAPVIDALGALGFGLAGAWLIGSRSDLIRTIGWLFISLAAAFLAQFVLGFTTTWALYTTGVGELFRAMVVIVVWGFIVRRIVWFPWETR